MRVILARPEVRFGLLFLLAAAGAVALWGLPNRPREAGPDIHKPLSSVSFAPFRDGQSPLAKVYPKPAEIEDDMIRLKGVARGLRTYTSREGMEVVPDLARRHGFKVTFGAWLGAETKPEGRAINAAETEALIKAANQHADVIERVIVGNEVLLRRDLPPDRLIDYIRRVKQSIRQPVTYADVWAFWLKHPQVANEVDFLTIHILPYWEDEPIGVDHVGRHFEDIHALMRKAFPGKPILIGEAGWPTQGRSRGPAATGTVASAQHLRVLVDTAIRNGFDYNVVEAFDQLWKSKLEGTVGAKWGLLDPSRRQKFPLAGPVVEDRDWPWKAGLAVLAALLALLPKARYLGGGPPLRALFAIVLAQALASALVAYGAMALAFAFVWWSAALYALLGLLLAWLAWGALRDIAYWVPAEEDGIAPWIPRLYLALAGLAIVMASLLIVDGRYRDIPTPLFLVPALVALGVGLSRVAAGVPVLAAFRLTSPLYDGRWIAGWGLAFPILALANLAAEGLALIGEDFTKMHPTFAQQWPLILAGTVANAEILVWSAVLLVLGLPFAAHWAARRRT
jgi:exo-beta-1,3-glucanase (GH17 family)